MIARKLLLSAFALLTIVFVGCKDDEPEFVALNVETKEIVEGQEYQFYVESYKGTITWSIDSEKVATIDQTGKVKGVSVGTTNVRALLSNGTNLMAVLTVNGRGLESDSISVAIETIKLAPNAVSKFGVNIVKKEYIDTELYPIHVSIDQVSLASESETEVPNPATVEAAFRADSTGYDITLNAGAVKAEYICKIALGNFEQEIPVSVDYGVYLSHNLINTDNLNDGIGLLTRKTINLGETLNYSFFCYLDGASEEQTKAIRETLTNKDNYVIEDLTLEMGDITIDESSEIWKVSMPLTSLAKSYELGLVSITVEDKTLDLNLTCDDGKNFTELYISFEDIYTYSEETKTGSRKLDNSYLKYIGGNTQNSEPETFKVIVWYTMSPDDRGDFIDWNLTMPQGANAPVKYLGMQKINTKQFEFEFMVNAAGTANIGFTIENPKADDPTLTESEKEFYEKYRTQTITALVSVVDRNTVDVESVVFVDDADPLVAEVIDSQETTAGALPLYTYILPEESAGPWPSIFSIECSNGAEATVKQSGVDESGNDITPELSITHKGTILVTATSKDKTATLEVTAKLKIDQTAQGEKLQIQTAKNEYTPGETDKIETILRSTYKVYDNEYTWTSSNSDVVAIDDKGNITAVADGVAEITVSITDDFGYTATATKTISVRSISADADLNASEWADYYVIDLDEPSTLGGAKYYIDTEDGADQLFTIELDSMLSEGGEAIEGTHNAGTDFNGTIEFPSGDKFNIVGGTITIAGGQWTFNLNVKMTIPDSDNVVTGTVTGTKEYLYYAE